MSEDSPKRQKLSGRGQEEEEEEQEQERGDEKRIICHNVCKPEVSHFHFQEQLSDSLSC